MIKEIKKKEWKNSFTKELKNQFGDNKEIIDYIIQNLLEDLEILGKLNGDNGDSSFYIQNILYKTGDNYIKFDFIFSNTKFEKWIGKHKFSYIHYFNNFPSPGKTGVLQTVKICKSYFA